jgi:hypothetical protein
MNDFLEQERQGIASRWAIFALTAAFHKSIF